ncbi:DnaJ domain-containing protein [Candidatus Vidania fulgoroideorum]
MNDKYYKILGLNINASENDIKKAYRRLAMKYHPDKNPGDPYSEEKFKEIKNAYEKITNKNNENDYNEDFSDFNEEDNSSGVNFNDIFGDFFEDNENDEEYDEYENLNFKINITLEQAAKGFDYSSYFLVWKFCDSCKGEGYINNKNITTCGYCDGNGYFKISKSFINIKQVCGFCKGKGKSNISKCSYCYGNKKIQFNKKINIKIPRGSYNGMKIKVNNKKILGNVFFEIIILKHDIFVLDKSNNIIHNIRLFFTDVLIGKVFIVKNLYNEKIRVVIPKCFDINKKIIFYNKGIYNIKNKKKTNLIIKIIVTFPKKISKLQLEISKKLANCFDK